MSRSAQAIIDYIEARLEEVMTRHDKPGGDTRQLILERIEAAQVLRAALDEDLSREDRYPKHECDDTCMTQGCPLPRT